MDEMVRNGEAPAEKARKRRPGTFKPGWRGGPGRPPLTPEQRAEREAREMKREAFKLAADEVVGELVPLLRAGVPHVVNVLLSVAQDENVDPAVRVAAAREYMDRAVGRPMQQSQIAVADVTAKLDRAEAQKRIDAILAGKVIEHREPSIFD